MTALTLLFLLPFILYTLRTVLTIAGWLLWLACVFVLLAVTILVARVGLEYRAFGL